MSLQELVSAGGISLTISATDLKQFALEIIEQARQDAARQLQDQQSEKYLTRQEVAKLLQVDLSTLNRWNRASYLCAVKVGNKVRYRLTDVKKLERGE